MRQYRFYVYIMANKKDGTLYIGFTNNIERRVLEHKQGVNEGFTRKYRIKKLVYFEEHKYVRNALTREYQMKKWLRKWKIELIEQDNPEWKDLAIDWYSQEELNAGD